MNFAQYAKAAVMTGLVTVAFWGQPQVAQAAEIVAPSDDVIVETSDPASSTGDPEWRYVPVRRTADASTDSAGKDEPDILYDPDDDFKPPVGPSTG